MLKDDLPEVAELTPQSFACLCAAFREEWIEQALSKVAGGAQAKVRKRKLPARLVLWLVIGMALLRDRAIEAVAAHLELVLGEPGEQFSKGSLPPARARLGAEPLEYLFNVSAQHWALPAAEQDWNWRGLSVWAADGTCFNVPDTEANAAAFERPKNGTTAGPFPQIRAVMLLNARSRIALGLQVGGYQEGELSLIQPLWERLPDNSLVLLDRGLHSWWEYSALSRKGSNRHWLTRPKKSLVCSVIKNLGQGDDLVEVKLSDKARRKRYPDAPQTMVMRRVQIPRKGFRPAEVLTSLIDHEKYPAEELVEMYVERWEIELAYDEVKTHMLDSSVTLRSKTPQGVRQEIYGIGIAYNLVRQELAKVAHENKREPRQISFRNGLLLIRNFLVTAAQVNPGTLPKHIARLERDLALLFLPDRRGDRRYPRRRKFKDTRYPAKKPIARTDPK